MTTTLERINPMTTQKGRAGFTLIELLIVVVIIGLLSAIAIPKFAATKTQAYVAQMKGDLRNLATAQEAYEANGGGYYGGALPSAALVYSPSPGIVVTIAYATLTGWGALASAPGLTTRTCALFRGNGAAVAPAAAEGQITCSP